MNKFATNLSATNKEICGKKAELLAKDAEDAQKDLIRELEKEERRLDRKLMDLEDLTPENTTSLGIKNFNAKEWVAAVQETKLALAVVKEELATANETLEYYFSDGAESKVRA